MRESSWRSILLNLALFLNFLGTGYAAPPVALVLDDRPAYNLAGHMETLSDATRGLTIRDVDGRTDWSGPLHEQVPNLGFTGAAVWLRFALSNREELPRTWYVSFEYPVADSVTLYAKDRRGVFQEQRAGDSVPPSAHLIPDRHFLFTPSHRCRPDGRRLPQGPVNSRDDHSHPGSGTPVRIVRIFLETGFG